MPTVYMLIIICANAYKIGSFSLEMKNIKKFNATEEDMKTRWGKLF